MSGIQMLILAKLGVMRLQTVWSLHRVPRSPEGWGVCMCVCMCLKTRPKFRHWGGELPSNSCGSRLLSARSRSGKMRMRMRMCMRSVVLCSMSEMMAYLRLRAHAAATVDPDILGQYCALLIEAAVLHDLGRRSTSCLSRPCKSDARLTLAVLETLTDSDWTRR